MFPLCMLFSEREESPILPLVLKEDIENVLVPHTVQRFTQYHETPFGHGTRRDRLGMDCDSDYFDSLLNGDYDYDLDSLSPEARSWLKQLERRDYVQEQGPISTDLSVNDWITGWAKMDGSTVCGGDHFGHYKTATMAARLPEKHENYFPALALLLCIPLCTHCL